MAHLNHLPENASLPDVFAAHPEIAGPALALAQAILRGPSQLSTRQREFLFAYGSGLNACHFCHGAHTAAAAALGADQNAIRQAVDDIDLAPVDEEFKPLLRYVKKLTETPSRLTRSDADEVRAAGWSDQALHDAIAVCALHNFFNRWVDGCGVDAPDDFLVTAGERLAETGYSGPAPAQ